jgi:hypothetical protein
MESMLSDTRLTGTASAIMRSTFVVWILALMTPAWCAEVPPEELIIGGIAPGETEPSVLRLLGEPSQRVETGEGTELSYP